MTREEAIAVLRREIEPSVYEDEKSIAEAIDMAIEALQKDIHRDEMVIRASERYLGVVRCKDCRWWNTETYGCNRNPCVEQWHEDDFCSYGEREEE